MDAPPSPHPTFDRGATAGGGYPARPAGLGPTAAVRPAGLKLSLVAPVHDEEENLPSLHRRIAEVFGPGSDWELVLVDDGSRDGSAAVLRRLVAEDHRVRALFFDTNRGQTTAIAAGLAAARAPVVATLDADLQNDPQDLPRMVARLLAEGVDAVVGFRQRRRDTVVRRISSRIANRIRNGISQDTIRDTGCSLKVFRAEAIAAVPLFEGMHRFLPTLLRYHGFTVVEEGVSHHPRVAGRSKYGISNRAWRAFKDLLAVRWMRGRLVRWPKVELLERDARGGRSASGGSSGEPVARAGGANQGGSR